ncbi:7-cyano-7-deazaguanine synthase [Bacillus manliponensis]|uniref:7-cyano-7-deazaguanine synthase n=1 Tax=Bacillus manliponensis TaxID=574376 RepID=UPI0022368BEF|nr:7-cyano-7-deazaguanine synthase [Bacillus manliponensis]
MLASGGIDSTALIHYYVSQGFNIKGIHFNYGQMACKKEEQAVKKIGEYYDIEIESKSFGFSFNHIKGEFIARNPLFILAASNLLPKTYSKIGIGIHSGTPYYDCTRTFINDCQKILDGYFAGTVIIEAPFLLYDKRSVLKFCLRNQVPIELTYSCEFNDEEPCGECLSCKDRRILSELSGSM